MMLVVVSTGSVLVTVIGEVFVATASVLVTDVDEAFVTSGSVLATVVSEVFVATGSSVLTFETVNPKITPKPKLANKAANTAIPIR